MIRLLALLIGACVLAAEPDGFERLRADPSPDATHRLSALYKETTDANQRFWIVHALGARLTEHHDPAALEALFAASSDKNPELRQSALRALSGFTDLPSERLGETLLARLDAAVLRGVKDKHPGVRGGAEDLRRALKVYRDPSTRKDPLPPTAPSEGRRMWDQLLGALRWLWVLVLPALALTWSFMGFPILDAEEGRRAQAAWRLLLSNISFLAVSVFLWFCLASLLAGYGFDLLALTLGRPAYAMSGGWIRAYYSIGMCIFMPAGLLCAGLARRPNGDPALACLTALPKALLLWVTAWTLLPVEFFYKLFVRGRLTRGEDSHLRWAMDFGVLRAAYWTLAAAAAGGLGLGPALGRARAAATKGELPAALGVGDFDPRFTLLCATPLLAFFCTAVAKGQPVVWGVSTPIILIGCAAWAWGVLTGILSAVAQTLEGVSTAAHYLKASGDTPPPALAAVVDA